MVMDARIECAIDFSQKEGVTRWVTMGLLAWRHAMRAAMVVSHSGEKARLLAEAAAARRQLADES